MNLLELKKIKGNTYYFPSPANIGLYVSNNDAILIDSGNDSDAGRQILKILNENSWSLKMIINTHSNADHCGGNEFLQKKTGCKIASTQLEKAFIENPILEPSFLYGGFATQELRNKFLMAKPSVVTDFISNSGNILDTGLNAISLPGHFFDMIGVSTPDGVVFLADSLFSSRIITKYHLFYLYDISSQLETLQKLSTLNYEYYVPSHSELCTDLSELIEINRTKINEIIETLVDFCTEPKTIDSIISYVFSKYNLTLNSSQYVLIGNAIRSYLSYLVDSKVLKTVIENNEFKFVK
ncbi:MBL fold metallo-hydrolase [Candidatus Woesearchaeota archaeon]|nr:MBL fold metallo-hydrolase [Candidatus Woesearchaeota archaeon]